MFKMLIDGNQVIARIIRNALDGKHTKEINFARKTIYRDYPHLDSKDWSPLYSDSDINAFIEYLNDKGIKWMQTEKTSGDESVSFRCQVLVFGCVDKNQNSTGGGIGDFEFPRVGS